MLKVKEEELQEDIKSKEVIIKKIKDICKYFNTTSNSPITHLYDIDHVMKQTSNLKDIRLLLKNNQSLKALNAMLKVKKKNFKRILNLRKLSLKN